MSYLKKIIAIISRRLSNQTYLKNVLKVDKSKKALICYITRPFYSHLKIGHTNIPESRVIAEIFNQLGFQVDVVDYDSKIKLNLSKYSCIFGFGDLFEQSFYDNSFKGKRIYYSTGAYVDFQNNAELSRIKCVNKKYNSSLLPKRTISKTWCLSTSLSDHIIVLGNEWTKSTFSNCNPTNIFALNASAFLLPSPIIRKMNDIKTNFLWFGGSGLIHKGLDLCLEFFSIHPDFQLHICGQMEEDFFNVFKSQIQLKNNIHYHGFITINSKLFTEVTSQCTFTIMPTCSEGQSTALLTTMGMGLIPIATKFCGVTIHGLGIEIEELSIDGINTAIRQSQEYTVEELFELSNKNINYIKKNHSIDSFSKELSTTLETILNETFS